MSPLIYEPESTTHTGKSTVSFYIFTRSQTTRHLSPSKFLPWLVKEYLIFNVIKRVLIKLPLTTITHLKTAVSTKTLNSHHDLLKEENAAKTFYGLIHHLAPTWKPTLAKDFCDTLKNTFQNTINITNCLIGIILKSAIVVCRTWQALFKSTTLIYWKIR